MLLYGTPPSHFTRKVRVVLQELALDYQLQVLDKLLLTGPEHFAGNPMHLLPILRDGERTLFDSSAICEYLIDRYGAGRALSSYLPVPESRWDDQQRLLVMNGGMSAGVSLIRAQRSGIENPQSYAFFRQEKAALEGCLRWLDADLGPRSSYHAGRFTMLEITLLCFLEWAEFRELLAPWAEIPNLRRLVLAHRDRPSLKSTHPALQSVIR